MQQVWGLNIKLSDIYVSKYSAFQRNLNCESIPPFNLAMLQNLTKFSTYILCRMVILYLKLKNYRIWLLFLILKWQRHFFRYRYIWWNDILKIWKERNFIQNEVSCPYSLKNFITEYTRDISLTRSSESSGADTKCFLPSHPPRNRCAWRLRIPERSLLLFLSHDILGLTKIPDRQNTFYRQVLYWRPNG